MKGQIREMVVVSGKGGTGKTTVSASFSYLCREAVCADCDVDAANLSLLLKGTVVETREFVGMAKAQVDPEKCTSCGVCEEACRFGAAEPMQVDPILCEGCGLCERLCPAHAITMRKETSGHWYVSNTMRGPLVHARLEPGGDNSGMLVTTVRNRARELCLSEGRDLIITDGPPGIGCPVISSLSGADLALLVTEPTPSGIHDLARVAQVCRQLDVPTAICINKYDLSAENTRQIQSMTAGCGPIVGLIPYDETVPRSMGAGMPVAAFGGPAASAIREMWDHLLQVLRNR